MEIPALDQQYWNERWKQGDTRWDIGHASSPLVAFFETLQDKEISILIPGCGNAYEAEYLHRQGFTRVFVVDIAPDALASFQQRVPDFPTDHLICADFFSLEGKQSWDLIIEQTFFCAINPSLRKNYVAKMHELLAPAGRLVGLLFNDTLNSDHPPFGGNEAEYRNLFQPYFSFTEFKVADNSIEPRLGREFFVYLMRKQI
jgi:methyl halide transferase